MEERNKEMLEFMITVLLADYDMMRLIELKNRPYDEYGPEARTILNYIDGCGYDVKLDTLAQQIHYIFEIWFDQSPDIVSCIKIAREIKLMI